MLRIRTMDIDHMPPYFSEELKYYFKEIYNELVRHNYGIKGLIPPAPGSATIYAVCKEDYMEESDRLKEEIDEMNFRMFSRDCLIRIEIISEKELRNTVVVIYER